MDINKVQNAIRKISDFLLKYEQLGDAHMVDYFTSDHWNNMVGVNARTQLMGFSIEELYLLPMKGGLDDSMYIKGENGGLVGDLGAFIKEAKSCRLNSLGVLTQKVCLEKNLKSESKKVEKTIDISSSEFMSTKKSHEIEEMAPIVKELCRFCSTNRAIDVGSGKGYLGSYLSLKYNINVTGLDCAESNIKGAQERTRKYFRYFSKINRHNLDKTPTNFNSMTARVGTATDLKSISEDSSVLIGLHTCGDLCATILRLFVETEEMKGVCVVGCCYHHLTESGGEGDVDDGFPMSTFARTEGISLGRNKRMLGLKSPERVAISDVSTMRERSEKSLFYRAVLSVILEERFGEEQLGKKDARIGKIFSKSKNFVDYVQKSLKKLCLDESRITESEINEFLARFEPKFKELLAFSMIRQIYAPAVEAMILLDKICYLLEKSDSAKISKVFLSEIFDPVKSPRCYAIIAVK